MKTYDVKCPVCGTVNHDLYLEETNGWMECECCGQLTRSVDFVALMHRQIREMKCFAGEPGAIMIQC